ncbi:MAG: restriction endonuclease subunit S [bacterium]
MSNAQEIQIKDLFDIEKGSLQSLKNTEGEFTFVTASEDWKTHNEYTHDCEALVFAMGAGGSLGRTHYIKGKFIASDLCFILTPRINGKFPVDLMYYSLYFNFIREKVVADLARGAAKKAINKTNFAIYNLPYIPIEEQKEIARKGMILASKEKAVERHAQNIMAKTSLLLKKLLTDSVRK